MKRIAMLYTKKIEVLKHKCRLHLQDANVGYCRDADAIELAKDADVIRRYP
jgi:hypothetical protein